MKTIDTKFIGGILLIVGTSIGGGMLALPLSNAPMGFTDSSLLTILCWLVMTAGALLILEVNLWLPSGSNMVSMAEKTLGPVGKAAAWFSYLALLYTLLSAYISGGADVFDSLLQLAHINLPTALTTVLFAMIFGAIVYAGIKSVDYINRGLMFGKLGIYILLVILISPHISLSHLQGGELSKITGSIMILITAFGFATIVPSLREYFEDDVKKLRRVIIIGSLIPLLCYIVWDAVIMGVIPLEGANSLDALLHSSHPTSGLTTALQSSIHNLWIIEFFRLFTSICMLTAFLGVTLCLFDFLSDGLHLAKRGKQGLIGITAALLPPLFMVLYSPGVYLAALDYAGILCVFLLLFLPALMAWRGRYHLKIAASYRVLGGKITLLLVALISILLLFIAAGHL